MVMVQNSLEEFKKVIFRFYDDDLEQYVVESLWAKEEGINYKLDNIPFHVYQYSCDDIVKVEEVDGELMVTDLIEASGNSTLRVLFDNLELLDFTKIEIENLGYEAEIKRQNKLLTINVPKSKSYIKISNYLESGENLDKWNYEESCISEYHKNEIENS